jgi:hypothetical protein
MIRQSPARIYKSQQRGYKENENHRLLATFNFETYQNENRIPFGRLLVLNDETLAPGFTIQREVPQGILALIIPLVGGPEYTTPDGSLHVIPGEAAYISGGPLSIKNPYENELVNFLYMEFKSDEPHQKTSNINLDIRNTLHSFLNNDSIKGFMGIFDGRQETLYQSQNPQNGLFIFVINGAFEVQGRLLEERDGLALWDSPEADMEALSENAIILLFELPVTGFTA